MPLQVCMGAQMMCSFGMAPSNLVVLPIILAYTALTSWLFRGKVAEGAAYH